MKTRFRTTIYIDAANLILGIRNYFQMDLDIYQLCLYFQDRYRADKCVYFTAEIPGLLSEYQKIKGYGIEVIFKKMYFENGKTKANCDVEIAHRITQDVENNLVDKIIFVSGDGDFASLLNYVKSKHKEVVLYAPHRKCTSKMLRNNENFNLTYVSQILEKVSKRKALAGHVASERVLFVRDSITSSQNLSSVSGGLQQKITVCGMAYKIEDRIRKVFLAKRAETKKFLPGKFELIGGHVEVFDKSLAEALKREVKEELGADIVVENLAGEFLYNNYILNSQSVEIIYWIRFADEAQIKLNTQDHSEFVWASEEEIDTLINDKEDLEYLTIRKAIKNI